MDTIEYVEDALIAIANEAMTGDEVIIDWKDLTILQSMKQAVEREGALTRKQSILLLKILSRYTALKGLTFDLQYIVDNPKWRSDFRKLDQTKSVRVEQDKDGVLWFVLKFPYSLLKAFEERVVSDDKRHETKWCPEERVKHLKFYEFNIVSIYEFAKENDFVIDETFIEALHRVEEVWQQQDNIEPYSLVVDGDVRLVNAVDDAVNYFNQHKTRVINQDLFLAKTMGYPYKTDSKPSSVIEKISRESSNQFWLKSNIEFLQLYNSIDGAVAVILDRTTENILEWLKTFVHDAKTLNIDTSLFRVCYREPGNSQLPFNQWVKENGLGGPIAGGRLFFFKLKAAKWLINGDVDVKVIATNNIIPTTDLNSKWLLTSHPCVCFISDIEPTNSRNKRIADL
jgi:hypothetical protein